MSQFTYRAKKGPKEIVNGMIDAGSLEEAVDKLGADGLLPIQMEEVKDQTKPVHSEKRSDTSKPVSSKAPRAGRIKSSDITMFGRQLSSLIRSGVPILRALWIITEQSENGRFQEILTHTQEEIKNGNSLSSALSKYPKIFPPIYIAMVRTGEESGMLQETLLRVSDYRKKQEEIFSKVRSALAYPALMALTGIGTIVFMLTFVVPRLTGLFSSMGSQLPLPTRVLVLVSDVFQRTEFWVIAGVVFFVVLTFVKMRADQLGILWSRLSLRLPIVKNFVLKTELARFTRTLELLIKCGIPILKAIGTAVPVVGNVVLRQHIVRAQEDITGGGTLGKSLKKSNVFPLFLTNMITVGEESGNLEGSLGEVASFYESETEEAIKILTSLIEPVMILVMGLVVGFIVIATLLPMFELDLMVQ